MSARRIEAIVFDVYGTLLDVSAIGANADVAFPGHGAAIAALWRQKQIEYTMLRTLGDRYADFLQVTNDALGFTLEQLGLSRDAGTMAALLADYRHLRPHPETLAALTALREAGLAMAVLSNGTPDMLDDALGNADVRDLLDAVLSVDPLRRYKIAPDVYRLGTNHFGLPASAILFVSSNGWDIGGAGWFGYTTFWINRAGAATERLGITPDFVGRSLDCVRRWVGEHNR